MKKTAVRRLLLTLGILGCHCVATSVPVYEPFKYPAGVNLAGRTNSEGNVWAAVGTSTAPLDGSDQVVVTNQSLNLFGLPPSQGNAVMFGGAAGWSARVAVGPPVITPTSTNDFTLTNGTVFYSFLLRIDDLGQNVAPGGFIAGFNNNVGTQAQQATAIGARIFVRKSLNGFNLGIGKAPTNNTLQVAWDPAERGLGTNIFVVAAYVFRGAPNSTDDAAIAWIHPDPSTFGRDTPPPSLLAPLTPPSSDLPSIRSFLLRQGNSQVPALLWVDELRIGTSWRSVTPPPELTISNSGPLIVISWTTNIAGYTLESTTDLTPTATWSPVDEGVGITGDHYFVTVNGGSGRQFFRLQRQIGNAPSTLAGRTIHMDNGDTITVSNSSEYSASFGGNPETGSYAYAPNGDNAILALTPVEGPSSTIRMTFNPDQVSGTYSIDESGQTGSFLLQ